MDEAIRKADVLIEALSYIRNFRDRLTVIKLGGSAMEDAEAHRAIPARVPVPAQELRGRAASAQARHFERRELVNSRGNQDRALGWAVLEGH